ncbi:WD40 repeat-like protein [Sistotremastrum niveocremeum HHB9708]|uniref:WD40 repeat-like protein n=1 Tax=Sistotremastrum niveocremeum HHB9708 TaxID=1314777 RepID=A0A164ZE70_9AGAM|nr:WD40 repeat-like protein [Sistotremastrum niveocremeum HHB9708]
MRTQHTLHSLPAFPVYSSAFVSASKVVVGGGGGSSKSGIKNKLRLYEIRAGHDIHLLDEYELAKGEDAPMCMAYDIHANRIACGVNSSEEVIMAGQNQNCRIFSMDSDKLAPVSQVQTFSAVNADEYTRVAAFSSDGSLLAVGATNSEISLLEIPSLTPVATRYKISDVDLYDLTFCGDTLVAASTKKLHIFSLPTTDSSEKASNGSASPSKPKKKKKKKSRDSTSGSGNAGLKSLQLSRAVEIPKLPGVSEDESATFRVVRSHPTSNIAFAVINTTPSHRGKKKTSRKSFLVKYNTEDWSVLKVRKIGEKGGVTCFDISADGRFLAYGTSDYCIGILDSHTLGPLLTILRAHEFPLTTLCFDPSGTLLISGSPDNSIRVVQVPAASNGYSWSIILAILLALLLVLLGVAIEFLQRR